MKTLKRYIKLLANSFDKMHLQLSIGQSCIQVLDDPVAQQLFREMEQALLERMRKLRLYLGIPYDWHEEKPLKNQYNRPEADIDLNEMRDEPPAGGSDHSNTER